MPTCFTRCPLAPRLHPPTAPTPHSRNGHARGDRRTSRHGNAGTASQHGDQRDGDAFRRPPQVRERRLRRARAPGEPPSDGRPQCSSSWETASPSRPAHSSAYTVTCVKNRFGRRSRGPRVPQNTSKRPRASPRRPHHGVLLVISAGKTAAHCAPPSRPARTPIRVLATFGARRRWRPHNLEPTRSWVCLCGRRHNVSDVRTTPRGRHSTPARYQCSSPARAPQPPLLTGAAAKTRAMGLYEVLGDWGYEKLGVLAQRASRTY